MKTWLKGGLTGIIMWFILLFIILSDWEPSFVENIIFPIEPLCIFITGCVAEECILCGMIILALTPFKFFIIGAIIGLIYGKIKSKEHKK